jgi:hypothetical protein
MGGHGIASQEGERRMKIRIGVIGVALAAVALWACTTTTMVVSSGPDGGGGDDGGGGGGASEDGSSDGGPSPTAGFALVSDPQGLCNKIVGCSADAGTDAGPDGGAAGPPITQADCLLTFTISRFPPSCIAGLGTASCADLLGTSPSLSSCFPSCTTPGSTHCNGDGSLTTCGSGGEQYVLDCAAACKNEGSTWTGVCGSSYQGIPSKTGKDQCFCQ